jgi:site-specific DNA recombinase
MEFQMVMAIQSLKRDATYVRYSSKKQDDSTSIEVQLEQTHKHPDIDAVPIDYVDRAKTGRALGKREAFKRLREDIFAGKIKRLFVYKYDRLGRSTRIHYIVEEFEKAGCEVISCTEGRDKLARGFYLVLATYYSEVLAERTREGLQKRFEQGKHTGGEVRYGYQVIAACANEPCYAIEPAEAETIRKIVQMYLAEPVGMKAIARRLQNLGIRTRTGVPWTHTTVRSILTNRMLVGEVRYNQRKFILDDEQGTRLPRWKDPSQHQMRREESLRIIEDEEFDAIQNQMTVRGRMQGAVKAVKGVRPFTGVLFCQECKSACYCRKSKNRKGEYRYYGCGGRQRKGPDACPNSGAAREDMLMTCVSEVCGEILADSDKVIAGAMKIAIKQMSAVRDEAGRLRRQIGEIDLNSRKLGGLLLDPDIEGGAKKALSRQIAEAESQRETLEGQLVRVAAGASDGQEKLGRAIRLAYRQACQDFAGITDEAHLNRFVEKYIGPMDVRADGIAIPRRLERTTASDESEAVVNSNIAGGGFEPPTSGL